MSETFYVEAPAYGPALDAVFVRTNDGGVYLCEFEHGVVKEFKSFMGHVVSIEDLVGKDESSVRRAISSGVRNELDAMERRANRSAGSRARCGCGNCGGAYRR